jgi:NAD(P)-dependent dehydrogenase (short-subunit alcohol dehydrogenase family)
VSGIYGNPGQSNYGAAKAGIAAFTQIASDELARYGVTVNAVAPGALTRMTEDLGLRGDADSWGPQWVAPVVVWLASPDAADVTGQVVESSGQLFAVAEGWHRGPRAARPPSTPAEVGPVLRELLAQTRPRGTMTNG